VVNPFMHPPKSHPQTLRFNYRLTLFKVFERVKP